MAKVNYKPSNMQKSFDNRIILDCEKLYEFVVQDVMLIAGGWDKMSYDVSSVTLHKDFVGVLANGQKCLPDLDDTVPDVDKKDKNCDECVGVAYASKHGRWIFRCGGKDQSNICENLHNIVIYGNYLVFLYQTLL